MTARDRAPGNRERGAGRAWNILGPRVVRRALPPETRKHRANGGARILQAAVRWWEIGSDSWRMERRGKRVIFETRSSGGGTDGRRRHRFPPLRARNDCDSALYRHQWRAPSGPTVQRAIHFSGTSEPPAIPPAGRPFFASSFRQPPTSPISRLTRPQDLRRAAAASLMAPLPPACGMRSWTTPGRGSADRTSGS